MTHPTPDRRPFGCRVCQRRFAMADGRYSHMLAKHPGQIAGEIGARLRPVADDDDDQSLAELAIEATNRLWAGEPMDDMDRALAP